MVMVDLILRDPGRVRVPLGGSWAELGGWHAHDTSTKETGRGLGGRFGDVRGRLCGFWPVARLLRAGIDGPYDVFPHECMGWHPGLFLVNRSRGYVVETEERGGAVGDGQYGSSCLR